MAAQSDVILAAHEPVVGKIDSLFDRDPKDHTKVLPDFNIEFQKLIASGEPWIASVKKDGSNGAVFNRKLHRRQDIPQKSRNYAHVCNRANGNRTIIAGRACWETTLVRGSGKMEKTVPFYIFDVTEEGVPDTNSFHIVGLVPIDPFEDKWAMSAVCNNPDDVDDPFIWASHFTGRLDVPVHKMTMSEFMGPRKIVSVELMCRKFADHNGFKDDRCFVSEHGVEEIPRNQLPVELTYDAFRQWFENDVTNRWADQEGVVFLFPNRCRRFKMHRGHFYMEATWRKKKESGLKFHYVISIGEKLVDTLELILT